MNCSYLEMMVKFDRCQNCLCFWIIRFHSSLLRSFLLSGLLKGFDQWLALIYLEIVLECSGIYRLIRKFQRFGKYGDWEVFRVSRVGWAWDIGCCWIMGSFCLYWKFFVTLDRCVVSIAFHLFIRRVTGLYFGQISAFHLENTNFYLVMIFLEGYISNFKIVNHINSCLTNIFHL